MGLMIYRLQVSDKQLYNRTSSNERQTHLNIGKEKHWYSDISHICNVLSFSSLFETKAVTNTEPKNPPFLPFPPQNKRVEPRNTSPTQYQPTVPLAYLSTPFRNLNLGPLILCSRLSQMQTHQTYPYLANTNLHNEAS